MSQRSPLSHPCCVFKNMKRLPTIKKRKSGFLASSRKICKSGHTQACLSQQLSTSIVWPDVWPVSASPTTSWCHTPGTPLSLVLSVWPSGHRDVAPNPAEEMSEETNSPSRVQSQRVGGGLGGRGSIGQKLNSK